MTHHLGTRMKTPILRTVSFALSLFACASAATSYAEKDPHSGKLIEAQTVPPIGQENPATTPVTQQSQEAASLAQLRKSMEELSALTAQSIRTSEATVTAIRDRDWYLQFFFTIFMAAVTVLGLIAVATERGALKNLRDESRDNWNDLKNENKWNWQRLEDYARRQDSQYAQFESKVSSEIEKTSIQLERLDHMIIELGKQEQNIKADMMAIKSLTYIRVLSQHKGFPGDAVIERIGTEVAKILGEIKPSDPKLLAEAHIHDAWVKKRIGRPELAYNASKRALECNDELASAHYNLACYGFLLGHAKEEVLSRLERAISLDQFFRYQARTETDFSADFRNSPEFLRIVGPGPGGR